MLSYKFSLFLNKKTLKFISKLLIGFLTILQNLTNKLINYFNKSLQENKLTLVKVERSTKISGESRYLIFTFINKDLLELDEAIESIYLIFN